MVSPAILNIFWVLFCFVGFGATPSKCEGTTPRVLGRQFGYTIALEGPWARLSSIPLCYHSHHSSSLASDIFSLSS